MRKLLFITILAVASATVCRAQLLLEERENDEANIIFDFGGPNDRVSRSPGFIGGQAGLAEFLGKYIHYPEAAARKQIGGQVVAEFVVEKDGHVSHIEITKKIGHGLDEEVERVLKSTPTFKPALDKKGQPIAVFLEIPITLKPPPAAASSTKPAAKKPASTTKTAAKKTKKQ